MFEWGRRFVYTGCSQNLSSVRMYSAQSSIGVELTRQWNFRPVIALVSEFDIRISLLAHIRTIWRASTAVSFFLLLPPGCWWPQLGSTSTSSSSSSSVSWHALLASQVREGRGSEGRALLFFAIGGKRGGGIYRPHSTRGGEGGIGGGSDGTEENLVQHSTIDLPDSEVKNTKNHFEINIEKDVTKVLLFFRLDDE